MKILIEGKLPNARVYKANCMNCGTLFEFCADEARSSRDPREGTLLVIKCPLPGCGKDQYVNA